MIRYYGDWDEFTWGAVGQFPAVDIDGQLFGAPDVRNVDCYYNGAGWMVEIDTPQSEDRTSIGFATKEAAVHHFRVLRRAEHYYHGVRHDD